MNPLGSIRKDAWEEVNRFQRSSRTLKGNRPKLWLRLLRRFLIERTYFWFIGLYVVVALLAAGMAVAIDLNQLPLAEPLLSSDQLRQTLRDFMAYLLGAQVTIVGLIFPLALGMVTLIVQREEGSSTNSDIQLYYDQSLAYAVGTSGIALATALVASIAEPLHPALRLVGQGGAADPATLLLTIALAAWMLVNFLATWRFLIVSLAFIRLQDRARLRRQFAATSVIPSNLANHIATQRFFALRELGQNEDADEGAPTFVEIWHDQSAAPAVQRTFSYPHILTDVWRLPLRLALALWRWRSSRAGKDQVEEGSPRLFVDLSLGAEVENKVVTIRSKGGLPLNFIELALLNASLRFAPASDDAKPPAPTDILEELADRVIVQIDRLAVTSFGHALREMTDFHGFLINAHTISDQVETPKSYAQLGYWRAEHEQWITEYRRLFERAAEAIDREDSFLREVMYVPAKLLPRRLDEAPPEIVAGIIELPKYMIHQLGHWAYSRRVSADEPTLPAHTAKLYEDALRNFVGVWEGVLQTLSTACGWDRKDGEAAQWGRFQRSWPALFAHLNTTAYLAAAATWHEDISGEDICADMFARWPITLRYDLAEDHRLRRRWLSSDLLDLSWDEVQAAVSPFELYPDWHRARPRDVFTGIALNAFEEVRGILAAVLAGWAGGRKPILGRAARVVKKIVAGPAELEPHERFGAAANADVLWGARLRLRFVSNAKNESYNQLVRSLDGMTDKPRIPGRTFTPSTRHRVEDLDASWLAMIAANSGAEDFVLISGRVDSLAREHFEWAGDERLRDTRNWLERLVVMWGEQGSKDYILATAAQLGSQVPFDEASSNLFNALQEGIATIDGARLERLDAAEVSNKVIETIRAHVEASLLPEKFSPGVFSGFSVEGTTGRQKRLRYTVTGIEKGYLVEPPMEPAVDSLIQSLAEKPATYVAARLWFTFWKRRAKSTYATNQALLLRKIRAAIGKVEQSDCRAIVLLPSFGPAWVTDLSGFNYPNILGRDAQRRDDVPDGDYVYSYAGADFYRVRHDGPVRIFSEKLLEAIEFSSSDDGHTVAVAAVPEDGSRRYKMEFGFGVKFRWRHLPIHEIRIPADQPDDA